MAVTSPAASSEPQYGGTITFAWPTFEAIDPYRYSIASVYGQGIPWEKSLVGDWAVDRKKFAFPSVESGDVPVEYLKGNLVQSWEMPDNLTLISHIRQGVRFQDKPPVNGREVTSDDFVWNLERTRKSPFSENRGIENIDTVKALDKWTVEIKIKPPAVVDSPRMILDNNSFFFVAKESVGKSGEIEDWHNIVGTGAWILDDYVPASILSFKKNPNYWNFDELHPKNRLPYADALKMLIIPDRFTEIAALRTGRDDRVFALSWQDAEGLKKSNPEILQKQAPSPKPYIFRPRTDK